MNETLPGAPEEASEEAVVMRPGNFLQWTEQGRLVNADFERGRLRLISVAEGILRVRFSPDAFTPRRSWEVALADDALAAPTFAVSEAEEVITVVAEPFTVALHKPEGRLSFACGGERFAEDLGPPSWRRVIAAECQMAISPEDELPPGRSSVGVRLEKRMAEGENYYGFGERSGLLNRRGRILSNWTTDPPFGHGRRDDTMYQVQPVLLALRPQYAWGLFLHSSAYSQFDAGETEEEVLALQMLGGELDYYLFAGPTPAAVVEQLTRLTGRPLMPPLWSLGYHQSRWGYETAGEVKEIARGFRERDIPLDVIHLDIDYMRGYRDFTFDPDSFPDPKKLIAELKAEGVRAVTIIDPGVKDDLDNGYEAADSGVAQGVFITNPDDDAPFVGYCWPDAALFPDFLEAHTRAWWREQHRGYVEAGVAGLWNDMNEPTLFTRPYSKGGGGPVTIPLRSPQGRGDEVTPHADVHNLYGHAMVWATFEGLQALRPEERPWVLTRSGFCGTQRYAVSWMGDNSSWWEHLQLSLPQLMNMALSGVPFTGVDIGGFMENCTPELYARWIQLGTFYPFMRTHACKGTRPQEPWSFGPEVEAIAKAAIELRYRLLPYLYTLAREAHRTGAPLFRPLFYDFPNDPATWELEDQAMVGPHLLVAPVLGPGVTHRLVYLPEGVWYDFWSGRRVVAGYHVAEAPLARIPVYVRGGAVLPLGNVRRSTTEPLRELTLDLYPAGESRWTLYEDDGLSPAFTQGEFAETRVELTEKGVNIAPREGRFVPEARDLTVQFHLPERPEGTTLDGREADWQWLEETSAAVLRWPDDGQRHEVEIED